MRPHLFIAILFVLISSALAYGQKLPDTIDGYKVYDATINLRNIDDKDSGPQKGEADAWIKIGDLNLTGAGLSGLTFEVEVETGSSTNSGSIDRITFSDFTINGAPVEIADYDHPFSFKKNAAARLPAPVTVFLSSTNIARTVYKELVESKQEWAVNGTVYVFGKFKKLGFGFKRVVPIKIEISIHNPLD